MSDWEDPIERRHRRRDRKDRRYADELPIFRPSPPEEEAPPEPSGWDERDQGSGGDGWDAHGGGWHGDEQPTEQDRWDQWSGRDRWAEQGWSGQEQWAEQDRWHGHDATNEQGRWAEQDEWAGQDRWIEGDGWDGQEADGAGADPHGPPGGSWGGASTDTGDEISIFGAAPRSADPGADDAGGVVYVQHREPRRFARWLLVLGMVAAVVALVLGGGFLWVSRQIDPAGEPGDEVALTIPSGTSTDGIAELLEEEGVVADATIFSLYVRTQGGGPFQAGDYVLNEEMAMGEVVEVLDQGPQQVVAGRITVPEGLVLGEIAEIVGEDPQFDAAEFLRIAEGGSVRSSFQPADKPLEGLLFPETYTLDGNEDETELLQRMVNQFDAELQSLGYADAEARVGLSPYETVIVASLIEAEAKDEADRRKISRVIHNRLDQGMRLGIDATVYYALGRRGGSLTQSDLEVDSPYNTRERAGLVPTPIGAPGAASLAAAIDPEPGPWLYYVLQDERTHAFSESYEEFLQNRRRAQQEGLIP